MRIALVSDLHIGQDAIAVDLCPQPLEAAKAFGLEKNFLMKFDTFVNTPEFKAKGKIDMLCVTGDISDRGDPGEFIHASKIICKIADSLGVPENRIFFVPGNHDVNWPVMKLTPTHFWGRFRYEPLLQSDLIFQKRLSDASFGAYDESPHFVAWETGSDLVVGINSAAFDDPNPDDGKHHGLIQQETLTALRSYLETVCVPGGGARICLLHHHPISYSDPRTDIADFSAAVNAENLFKLLSEMRFDLILHGHKHIPHLQHVSQVTNGHPVTVLGSGSLSAQISPKWCGLAQNQFHVIQIEGRDHKTTVAFGHVATWNFLGDGWRPGSSQIGLGAAEGFGTFTTPAELESEISMVITQLLMEKEFCSWAQITSKLPHLPYVESQAVYAAVSNVASRLNLTTAFDSGTDKKKWLIVRETEENE